MKWNADITNFGWLIVGVVLGLSGIQHLLTPEIHGRVRVAGQAPLLAGWSVVGIGLVEAVLGITLAVWAYRKLHG